jgi:hypothetical protein
MKNFQPDATDRRITRTTNRRNTMKRAIILGSALSVLALVLVSCSSEPSATTTTTRQTTATNSGVPPPKSNPVGNDTGHPGY